MSRSRSLGTPADDFEPDFSPDGTQIVYRSNREGGGIYLTSSLGVSEPQLVARNGHSPRFSPDGKWITYYVGERSTITNRPMRSKLFIIERATGQVQQLAPQLLAACAAVWSPDSKYILFSGSDVDHINAPMDWYVVAAGNGSVKPLGAIDVFSRQGLSELIPHGWGPGDEVTFSANLGDSRNMWRIPISRVAGPPDREPSA